MRINGIKRRAEDLWILELHEGEPELLASRCVDGRLQNDGEAMPALRREARPLRRWFIPLFSVEEARAYGGRIGEWL